MAEQEGNLVDAFWREVGNKPRVRPVHLTLSGRVPGERTAGASQMVLLCDRSAPAPASSEAPMTQQPPIWICFPGASLEKTEEAAIRRRGS